MEVQKKGIIEQIGNVFLNICIAFFGFILLISLYNNLQIKVFGRGYSDFFGYTLFEVQTGSMEPEISAGDWIIVKATNNIELKDIITYNQDGEYITHRVIGTYNKTYVTKGDANNSKDEPIDANQIIGKVVKILPNFGIFKRTIFNPIVLASVIITILVFNFVFQNKKKNSERIINKKNISEVKSNIVSKIKNKRKNNKLEKIKEQKQDTDNIENLLNEIEETKEKEITKEIVEEEPIEEISSYIPVDASELDSTFLEIAENEIEEEQIIDKKIEKIEEAEEEEKKSKVNLELLNTGKKSKNIIDKFISVKIEEINEIINILDTEEKTHVNEPTIKNKFMLGYIEAKYYNYYDSVDVSNMKKQSLKIQKYLENISIQLKNKYKGNDLKYSEKVDKFLNIFNVITNLEQAKASITDRKARDEFYKKELSKYSKISNYSVSKIKTTISEITKIQRNYVGITEYLVKKLDTNMFELVFNKLKTNKNTFALSLEHNITFGKVYSDYIIDKTYNEGIIAENKTIILLNLLSVELIKDMLNANFDRKYIIYFPTTLYTKEKKIEKILAIINDEYAKENVTILISSIDLIKNKTLIKKIRKDGYKFCTTITSKTKLESKNYLAMSLVEQIFVDRNIPNVVEKLSMLPEDLADKLVYEDIVDKIGDFGGEE